MPRILSHVCWSGLIGVGAGLASAVFLITLTMATTQFTMQPWLIWLLPCAGALVAWVYQRFGASANAGNNLILEQLHTRDRAVVPLRMLPLVLLSTLITHLTGGSTGREGTAVQ
ncbi:MAG: chloride channel protein, partial [Roseiflexaceae bacterium]